MGVIRKAVTAWSWSNFCAHIAVSMPTADSTAAAARA